MPRVLHHALSLTLAGEWVPLDELAAALDPGLAERLPELVWVDGEEVARRDEASAPRARLGTGRPQLGGCPGELDRRRMPPAEPDVQAPFGRAGST